VKVARHNATAPSSAKRDIRGLTLPDLENVIEEMGESKYRARQIAGWLYNRGVESFDAMSDVPASLREKLAERFTIGSVAAVFVSRSADSTRKLLLTLHDGEQIESVIIPAGERVTLCLSTQAGCAMGCEFCATAMMGLRRNLTAGEIVGQIFAARNELDETKHLTNYVFMGMGEPLANYPRLHDALTIMAADWGMSLSQRRITVSTVGIAPMMERLLADFPVVNLAVSFHAPADELRSRLVPLNRRYPLATLIDTCRRLPLRRRDRITFEYVMLKRVNDSPIHAAQLVKLLAPLCAKVNLIMFNPFDGAQFEPSDRDAVERFQAILRRGKITATIRESRGRDIAAACGQLYVERHGLPARRASRHAARLASIAG
jgi:23S rRNA (adenine2503-C2)-methyltransferase